MILGNCDIDLWRHKQTLTILWYWLKIVTAQTLKLLNVLNITFVPLQWYRPCDVTKQLFYLTVNSDGTKSYLIGHIRWLWHHRALGLGIMVNVISCCGVQHGSHRASNDKDVTCTHISYSYQLMSGMVCNCYSGLYLFYSIIDVKTPSWSCIIVVSLLYSEL